MRAAAVDREVVDPVMLEPGLLAVSVDFDPGRNRLQIELTLELG
jgi:hypothetical protein